MYRIDRTHIKKDDALYPYLLDCSNKARCLYNATLFRIRQNYTSYDKNHLTANEQQVFDELTLLKLEGKHRVLNYYTLEKLMRITQNPDFFAGLSMQTAQNVIKQAAGDFTNWLTTLTDYKKNPGKYKAMPRMPHYKRPDSLCDFKFTNQDAHFSKDNVFKFPKTKLTCKIPYRENVKLAETKVIFSYNGFDILTCYDIPQKECVNVGYNTCSIDIGVDNIMSVISTNDKSIIFKGGYIKAENQYFNKKKAELTSIITKGHANYKHPTSHRISALSSHRLNFMRDTFHKLTCRLMDWCVDNDIGTIVIGSNKFWKQDTNLGKRNNQNFVSIPFNMLKMCITYKAQEYGIKIIMQEESYTSKADFFADDYIPTYKVDDAKASFSGKRTKRGLYRTSGKILINADLNGAANILRKAGIKASNITQKGLSSPEVFNYKDINKSIPLKRIVAA